MSVAGGMGGLAQKYAGPRAGEVVDDGGWGDFQDDEDRRLPLKYMSEHGLDTRSFEAASMDSALPPSNRGYMLLQRMGWKAGEGLGKTKKGRLDPVRLDEESCKMGLGKASELNYYHTEATKVRVKLDSEITPEEHREKRQAQAEKSQKIEAEIAQVTQKFRCDICDKQYKTSMQYQEHLDSYDHHHTKRFKEMKAMMKGTNTESKESRQAKREAKEMKKAMKQAAAAAQALQDANGGGQMANRSTGGAVSMSFGKKRKVGGATIKKPFVFG